MRLIRTRLVVVLLAGCSWSAGTASGQFKASRLHSLSRSGAQAGTTIELAAVAGDGLQEVNELHFSHPAMTADLRMHEGSPFRDEPTPIYGEFIVKIPADVPPGRYEVRARGRHGISNPRAFLVSQLECEKPAGVSHDAGSPTPLPVGRLLFAKSTTAEVDYFSINLGDGQSLQIETLAQRLDSRMIAQLKLYNADGRVVAATRGADDVDPVLILDGLVAGQYVLAVHDFLYRGGDDVHYQIAAQELDGAINFVKQAEGQLPEHWSPRACTLLGQSIQSPGPSPAPHTVEVPSETVSWFPPDQTDTVFDFTVQQGRQVAIDVVSDRLGEPTDARLMIQRLEPQGSGPPKLHDLINEDDSQNVGDAAVHLRSKDPVVFFTAPATATYRLSVRDLDIGRTLHPNQKYKLRLRQPDPGFDLVAYQAFPHKDVNQSQPSGSKLFRGGAEAIRVLAIRRDGWTGPIKIVTENLPPGVSCSPAVIAANQNQTQLTLVAAEDAPPIVAPVRIAGQSEDGMIVQNAVPLTVVWGRGGGRDYVRSRIASGLVVSVSELDLSPLAITLGDRSIPKVKKGESVSLPIKLTRREGGKASCVLRPRDLPPGVTSGDLTVAADKNEANIQLKVTPGTAAGTYSLWLQAETKIKIKPNPQSLERAQNYRAHLQTLHDDPAQAEKLESIKAEIANADKTVEAAKAMANEQELSVFLPTSHTTIEVVDP